jgi:chaperone BCS1
MTTNCPEKLDEALIRPGRVDIQIKFTLATREQIVAIFKRMYGTGLDVKKKKTNKDNDNDTDGNAPVHNSVCLCQPRNDRAVPTPMPAEKLAEMAEQFANLLPDTTFSPAEIHGYLLMKKNDAAGALAGVVEWKDKVVEAKKKGKKVVDV